MSARFKIHPSGNATISGINYRVFRSILDAASIHYHEDIEKFRKSKKKQEKDLVAYQKEQLKAIDYLRQAIHQGIEDTFPNRPAKRLTKAERFAKVRASEKERAQMDNILTSLGLARLRKGRTRFLMQSWVTHE